MRPLPPQIGPYRLVRFLGQGGCGQVFLALLERGDGFRRPVALKRLIKEAAEAPSFERDLRREARIGALVHHPNVVQVYDQFRLDDELFLVMEYVDGETLTALLGRNPHGLPEGTALDLARELLAGLAYLHALCDVDGRPLALVHRDLKPGNLMLARTGHLKIMDLGIARADTLTDATRGEAIKGSWRYMAPEQARGEAIDQRVDVYAAGAILVQLLTGSPLCGRRELSRLVACARDGRHLETRPRLDALPPLLSALVSRATAADPAARFPSAGTFADGIRAIQRGDDDGAATTARLRDLLPRRDGDAVRGGVAAGPAETVEDPDSGPTGDEPTVGDDEDETEVTLPVNSPSDTEAAPRDADRGSSGAGTPATGDGGPVGVPGGDPGPAAGRLRGWLGAAFAISAIAAAVWWLARSL